MKRLILFLAAVTAALAFVSSAIAAPSMGTISLPAQATPIALQTQSGFAVNTSPITSIPGSGVPWSNAISLAENEFYGNASYQYPLALTTITCWALSITTPAGAIRTSKTIVPASFWKCNSFTSPTFNPSISEADAQAMMVLGSIGTSGYNDCSWLAESDACSTVGVKSTYHGQNLVPNLDSFVGQAITFNANENWCTFLAKPAYDVLDNMYGPTDVQGQPFNPIGCYGSSDSSSMNTLSTNSSIRLLAASGPTPIVASTTFKVQAGPRDCHIPLVKGRTLSGARRVLRAAHCRVGHVRYIRGTRAGRVRYQPLKVGTGKPRGFKVKLSVVR